jgi:hypothetical protein
MKSDYANQTTPVAFEIFVHHKTINQHDNKKNLQNKRKVTTLERLVVAGRHQASVTTHRIVVDDSMPKK